MTLNGYSIKINTNQAQKHLCTVFDKIKNQKKKRIKPHLFSEVELSENSYIISQTLNMRFI